MMVINMKPGAHLSLASGNVNTSLGVSIRPEAPLFLTPGGVNRGPVINTYPGAHLAHFRKCKQEAGRNCPARVFLPRET